MSPTLPPERSKLREAAARRAKERGPLKLPEWPPEKPRPSFSSSAEELQFLGSYSFGAFWAAKSKASARRAKKTARDSVYRLRLTPEEREALESRAHAQNVPTAAILRGLIGSLKDQLRITAGATAQLPAGQGAFAHLNVSNLGAALSRVRFWVQFFRAARPAQPLFAEEMPARWSWAPEPFSGSTIDHYKLGLGHMADFAPREEHAAAIALKLADGTCWGWTPDSYVYAGRHPKWQLPAEPLLVRAHVLANGKDYFEQFFLEAAEAPQGFETRATVPGEVVRLTPAAKAEVEQMSHLKLIRGGR